MLMAMANAVQLLAALSAFTYALRCATSGNSILFLLCCVFMFLCRLPDLETNKHFVG